jgi:hypothetical protein
MELLHSDKKNPDASLSVQFYTKQKKNNFRSNEEKRDVFDSVDYIKIGVPGDILNAPDRPMNNDDKKRFPVQWAAFKSRAGVREDDIKVTPLAKWGKLDEDQVRQLEAMKFMNVESIAQASDAHVMGIGMIAGQSAFSFRDDARAFLAHQEAQSKLSEADLKVQAMKAESEKIQADMLAKMEAMQAQMTAMAAMVNAQAQTEEASQEPPRRGRPPKVAEAA